MKILTVYPPNYHPVSLFVQDGKVLSIDPLIAQAAIAWLHREGFIDFLLGKISEDIAHEAGLIDKALNEMEAK